MKKITWVTLSIIVVLIAISWFAYQKNTDDTYEGMSIIPEQYKDIPLFDGLKPTESKYVMQGNHWKEIYDFYLQELPMFGWKVEHIDSALNDEDIENDWGGFYSRWRKEGFDGELWIGASYSRFEDQTEVGFDKTPIYNSTTWIDNVPDSICIYQSPTDEKCAQIKDKTKIEGIVGFINSAIDWGEGVSPRENTSVIDFGNINVKVLYESDKEIYFESEKGTKLMKPEPDFFELTNLPR